MRQVLIFGGESYYACGGANDFLCEVDEKVAQFIAHNLIGTKIKCLDKWDTEDDYSIEVIIEWTHVATKEGIILHTFGTPFGPPLGQTRIVEYLEGIKNGNNKNLRLG